MVAVEETTTKNDTQKQRDEKNCGRNGNNVS